MDDERGFAAFYRDHREHLYRAVAVTLGDVRLAEEAVDEAFTRAAERWSQVGAFGRPAGWVYRVAVTGPPRGVASCQVGRPVPPRNSTGHTMIGCRTSICMPSSRR